MSIKAEKIYIFLINNSTNTLILNLLNSLRKLYIYRAEVKNFNWLYMGDNIHKTISMTYYLKNLGSASSQGSKIHYGELPRQASAVIYLCLTVCKCSSQLQMPIQK